MFIFKMYTVTILHCSDLSERTLVLFIALIEMESSPSAKKYYFVLQLVFLGFSEDHKIIFVRSVLDEFSRNENQL